MASVRLWCRHRTIKDVNHTDSVHIGGRRVLINILKRSHYIVLLGFLLLSYTVYPYMHDNAAMP